MSVKSGWQQIVEARAGREIKIGDVITEADIDSWTNDISLFTSSPTECAPEFKTYYGFSEAYEYCIHCDAKQGIKE
jgi:hypothetical protein